MRRAQRLLKKLLIDILFLEQRRHIKLIVPMSYELCGIRHRYRFHIIEFDKASWEGLSLQAILNREDYRWMRRSEKKIPSEVFITIYDIRGRIFCCSSKNRVKAVKAIFYALLSFFSSLLLTLLSMFTCRIECHSKPIFATADRIECLKDDYFRLEKLAYWTQYKEGRKRLALLILLRGWENWVLHLGCWNWAPTE